MVEAIPEGAALATANLPLRLPSSPASATYYVTITSSLCCKVRPPRHSAAWPFQHISNEFGIAVSTVYSICQASTTPQKVKLGLPKLLNAPIRKQLITLGTANQINHRLPHMEIASLAGIQASSTIPRLVFA